MVYFASTYILQSTLLEVGDVSTNRFEEGGARNWGVEPIRQLLGHSGFIARSLTISRMGCRDRCWMDFTYPLQICILAGSVIDRTRHVG